MVWQLATFVTRRRIIQFVIAECTKDSTDTAAFDKQYYRERAKALSPLLCVCREWYQLFLPALYMHYIITIDNNRHTGSLSLAESRLIHTLYIEVLPTVSSKQAITALTSILSDGVYSFHTVIVEADLVEDPAAQTTTQPLFICQGLSAIYLKSANTAVHMLPNTAAQGIAGFLSCLKGYTAVANNNAEVGYVLPVVISELATPTSLVFTSLDAQANAYELVRRSAHTLVSLTFLMSSYTALRRVLYGTESLPIVFPQLRKLCGTLANGRWFAIPLGTFPRLQMLCDKLHLAWQQQAGGTAHALASLVMQIELPELTTLATHTAAGMDLVPANVPNLRSAEYSIQPFSAERLRDEAVSAQLHRLLLLPHLHRLLLHDQIPTVSVRTDQVDLWHYELRYLNVGLITVSFGSAIKLLRSLQWLQTLVCTISDLVSVAEDVPGDQALSNTLHTLAMYVIRNKTLIIDRRPSEVILARLPQLALVQVQADSLAVDGYLRGLGQQLRFPWSQDVAERVSVVETDLFARAT